MTFEFIKQRIIKSLIEEIECLDAVHLELVGTNVISILEKKRMIHHGINKDYKPSGYTVDSFSDDSSIIAEYSTDKSYFEDKKKKEDTVSFFDKIENDINHALDHSKPKRPKKIYLITSQNEPPSFRSNYNSTPIAKQNNDIVTIYDNRELAKLIYKQSIESVDYASYYKLFFPNYSQNLDNYEYYGKVPAFCENHISDIKAIEQIKNHFSRKNICVLSGISGSGKTQLAIDYIRLEKNQYENYLWISGQDWSKDSSLSSIQRTRGGAPVNVSGLFNTSKTILVIDNCNRAIDSNSISELSSGFSLGSKLIITSQISDNSDLNFPVPEISDEVALRIIGEIPSEASELCKKVVEFCKCSPLILSTIRSVVKENGVEREDLYNEVLKYPNDISDNNGKSIMGGILNKLEPNSFLALKKIANSGSTIHDSEFLGHYLGIFNRSNLQRLSLLLPASIPSCLKIHDLVFQSVQDNPNSNEISQSIETYIKKHNATMSPSVIRQIHLCYDTIVQEYDSRDKRKPDWLTYAILQVEGNKKSEIQEALACESIIADMELPSVLSIIDAKEAHAYLIEDKKDREKYYKECIKEYSSAKDNSVNEELKIELLHHLGKTYRRCGMQEEALDCFLQIISATPNLHATHLQIAQLGSQYDVDKSIKTQGEQHLKILIDSILNDYSLVPLRVSLGSFAKVRSYKNLKKSIDDSKEQVEKIANIVALSSFEGFGQFYEAFVAFTSMFGYHHSDSCIKLIESLPELLTIPPESMEKYNWVNACEAFTNIAIATIREGKGNLSKRVIDTSLSFADKILEFKTLSDYQGRVLAKAYNVGGKPDKALLAIDKVPIEKHNHWLIYRKSEAQLKKNNPDACESAKIALNLALKDSFATSNIPSYHDLYSQCAKHFDKIDLAISQAKLAYEKCDDEKYKPELEEKLKQLEKKK
ncbi:tetratricopeptide repeat protein [Tenacibaculum maritimum]|uniref:tetratricopeptide repeat protein n=1 Tax=Tenacibaculum maritimum TaxID=107401 RepID=UPI0012E55131|nr:tetratricopeptide repeat protein [Tenacibaculum maritimum]CAA0189528.1 conserved hypothetical protein [Tenacibaculum maritimum]